MYLADLANTTDEPVVDSWQHLLALFLSLFVPTFFIACENINVHHTRCHQHPWGKPAVHPVVSVLGLGTTTCRVCEFNHGVQYVALRKPATTRAPEFDKSVLEAKYYKYSVHATAVPWTVANRYLFITTIIVHTPNTEGWNKTRTYTFLHRPTYQRLS